MSLWLSGRVSEHEIRRSEVPFLVGTQSSWQDEKRLSLCFEILGNFLVSITAGTRLEEKDTDRLVLSADKGNCVVVMDKQQYHDKALSLPNDKSTYSGPTGKTRRKLHKMLLDLTAYVHVFMAKLKFVNREFLGDLLSFSWILRLMPFRVILREFCRLLMGILITLSKFLRICGFHKR